jgi:hypothetical protein
MYAKAATCMPQAVQLLATFAPLSIAILHVSHSLAQSDHVISHKPGPSGAVSESPMVAKLRLPIVCALNLTISWTYYLEQHLCK